MDEQEYDPEEGFSEEETTEVAASVEAYLEAFLEPISAGSPSGSSIRYDPVYDEIREARRADDPNLAQGIWETDHKVADWATVIDLAQEVLTQKSKDLMVAAWLGEAWIGTEGLVGLEAALGLSTLLTERFWETLHPQAEGEDYSFRTAPYEWLAANYSTAFLTKVLLLGEEAPAPLDSFYFGQWQSWDRQSKTGHSEEAQSEIKQNRAQIRALPVELLDERIAILTRCRTWLKRLETWCDKHMADDAPAFRPLTDSLNGALELLQEPKKGQGVSAATLPPPVSEEKKEARTARHAAAVQNAAIALPAGNVQSRTEAYQQLSMIADYLAQTEPHSPVPYLLYQAVEWGDKTLPELLGELIDSDDYARRLWSQLGVLP